MLNQFKQYDMKMDETIIVSSIIDKLPPSWKNFKRSLKHKKEDITLEALANHLRIEEEYRKQDQNHDSEIAKVHIVEEGQTIKAPKSIKRKFKQTANASKFKKKQKGSCCHCGKLGHFKNECRLLKKKNISSNPSATEKFVAMISEINMVEDNDA